MEYHYRALQALNPQPEKWKLDFWVSKSIDDLDPIIC
jgi:hypothetical protein